MNPNFDKSFFQTNRAKLRSLLKNDSPIVLTANGLMQRSADTTFPFRQDSNFWYLTGINEPDLILVIEASTEYLILPERSNSRQTFDGTINENELTNISGITSVLSEKTGWNRLAEALKKSKSVATLSAPKSYIVAHGIYTNPARNRLLNKFSKLRPGLDVIDIRHHVTSMRMVKQSQEIDAIQHAINITASSLTKIKDHLRSFKSEQEIEAHITNSFNINGYEHAYAPIIASGKNACTLHYIANNSILIEGELILLDVGAEVSLYAADITRTYSTKEPTKRQLEVWQAVIEVQDYCKSLLKPGVDIRTYEKQSEAYMGEKLLELGLIKEITSDAIRTYYPHATSHFLGLDVHDTADYERKLEPGMVLTVEPGIYIPEESIGVRIEDNIAITKTGINVLSNKLPREL